MIQKRPFFLTLLFLIISSSIAFAQTVVTGRVTDENKSAVMGASVVVKGTSTGTSTDSDGRYSLNIPANVNNPSIVVRIVGYAEQEIAIKGSGEINVNLVPDTKELNTVVVAASKKREKLIDAPASVTIINTDQIARNTPLNVTDNLRSVPGIDIMKTGLTSQNVVSRGFNGIFSGSLMTLVDNRIASMPSLKVNAHQLIPSATADISKIEVVRGPGSALYGPNTSDGVLYIETKSPLDIKKRFETNVSFTGGTRGIINPEISHSGKITDKIGYRISAGYLQGNDWEYYDSREPKVGELMWYGANRDGGVFAPDTIRTKRVDGITDSFYIRSTQFDRNFKIRRYTANGRFDFRVTKDIDIIVNAGYTNGTNLELTGLGAAQVKNWQTYHGQVRFKWKNLFVQYYLNGSNSGETYLIPQNSTAPHKLLPLIDKSKLHVVQAQHSSKFFKNKLGLIYGVDFLMTRPETEGTIHGRFENNDNTNQYGGYLQANYDPLKWLKIVGAVRVDYHDRIKEVQVSPRGALVFKPHPMHTLRLTYNRAFSTPSSLNLFLDLANARVPNGISVRGFGNAEGYDYRYDASGNPMFINAYDNQWYSMQNWDKSKNYVAFNNMTKIIASGLASQTSFSPELVNLLLTNLFKGIADSGTGTVNNVNINAIDIVTGQAWNGNGDLSGLSSVNKVKSTVNQTYEFGYKGVIKNKLFLSVDFYYTRYNNFISPLTNASPSIVFNPNELAGAMGTNPATSQLYANLQLPSITGGTYDQLLTSLVNSSGEKLLDGKYAPADKQVAGTVFDDLIYLILGANNRVPLGTASPDNSTIGKDVILVYRNLGKVDVAGVDLGFSYLAFDNKVHTLKVSGAGSFMNKDRIPLAGAAGGYVALNSPKWRTAVSIDQEFKKTGLGYGINWRWQDAFPANSAVYVGNVSAANMLDLKLTWRPAVDTKFHHATFVIGVQNVLGYKWASFPGTPQIGRLATAKVSYTF